MHMHIWVYLVNVTLIFKMTAILHFSLFVSPANMV